MNAEETLPAEASQDSETAQSSSESSDKVEERTAVAVNTASHDPAQVVDEENNVVTGPEESSAPVKRASGWFQILALLQKNFLTRYRTPIATFMELFSPVLMMLVLVAAYQLSEVTSRKAQQYDEVRLDVPGPWADLLGAAAQANAGGDAGLSEGRRLEREDEKSLHQTILQSWPDPPDFVDFFIRSKVQHRRQTTRRRLQFGGETTDDDEEESGDDENEGIYDVLDDAHKQIKRLLKNPLPVPSFSQYVALSTALSDLIDVEDLPRVFAESSYGGEWGNLLTLGTLHLSPKSAVALEFWRYLNETYPMSMENNTVMVRIHETERDAIGFIDDNLDERTWALLDFSSWPEFPVEDIKYKIRMNATTLPNTNEITDFVTIGLNTDYQRYYLSGYLTLQQTLNEFAFEQAGGSCPDLAQNFSSIWSMPMPTAAYEQNKFFLAVGYLLGLTITMSFLYPTSRLIKTIVEEKETRMKETLFILGVRPWAHWWSWFLTSFLVFFVISVLVTIVLSANVLKHSSTIYLFAWIGFFSLASVGFCFALAALFSKAKLAAIIGPMALFATILPRFIFFDYNRYEASRAKKWASILPATAFAFGADIVADYEYAEQGIQSWNAGEGDYSFNTSLGFLIFDTILYLCLGWYLEQVIPREYGTARPIWFVFSPKYWCSCIWPKSAARMQVPEKRDEDSLGVNEPVEDPSLVPGVVIQDLVKRYNKKKDVPPAVNNLNLTLYESQITTLLGHNGAGKTTAVSLLTGLFPPTAGDCIVYGNSIVHEIDEARHSVGICPQQNILFDRLTVLEHITFFQRIKGIRASRTLVKGYADEIGLQEFYHTTASALSGGNKRKLSVTIALCGEPQCLILDEPTSGMDPKARRSTWELLRKKRTGRTILLTTHFMDEAELLSDRIAVMRSGSLQCSGSPLFLKNRFGLGYNFTVVLESARKSGAEAEERLESGGIVEEVREADTREVSTRLLSFLKEYVPGASLARIGGRELTFRFAKGQEDNFPACFDALELQRQRFGASAFGIENASLEEVFILLAETTLVEEEDSIENTADGPGNPEHVSQQLETDEDSSAADPESRPTTDTTLAMDEFRHVSPLHQIGLLYRKRLMIQKRDWKGLCFAVVVPVLLVGLVLLVLMIEIRRVGPAIEVSPNLYRTSNTGSSAQTDFNFGGGIAMENMTTRGDHVALAFAQFDSLLQARYPHVKFRHLKEATSSSDLSQHLLETINLQTHNTRFGALVLEDVVNLTVNVDFPGIFNDWERLANTSVLSEALDSIGPFDLVDAFGSEGILTMNISVSDLAELYLTLGRPEARLNFTSLQNLTDALGSSGFITVSASSVVIDAGSGTVALSGVRIESPSGSLFGQNSSFSFDFSLEELQALLPGDAVNYTFGIETKASILHNASSPHAVAAFNQAFVQYLFGTCSNNTGLVSINKPLPLTTAQTIEVKAVLSVLASLFILIPFCYIPGAFVVFIVKEKTCKSKHLQLVSGVDMTSYWCATYLYDVSLFFLLTILVMVVFLIYGTDSAEVFVGDFESFCCTALLTFGYGLSVLPFSYLLARRFDNHSSAQIAVIGLTFITGFVATNAYFIMDSIESTEDVAASLRPLFRTWPAYNVGDGFIQMASAYWERRILGNDKSLFDWTVAGKSLTLLYCLIIPYFLLLLMLEYAHDGGSGGSFGRALRFVHESWETLVLRWYGVRKLDGKLMLDDGLDDTAEVQDEDVQEERMFVSRHSDELKRSAPVMYEDLWKIYPPSVGMLGVMMSAIRRFLATIFCCLCRRSRSDSTDGEEQRRAMLPKRAVRGVYTVVEEGETYALLGENGAGKSTTMSVLTGDVRATAGQVFVAGHDVSGGELTGVAEARKKIGFCPQVDPLLDLMTVRETLRMFGSLRGIPKNRLDSHVNQLIDRLTLTPHADKTSESLSGGNKRKLSLGIALIGNPPVLLIDESSSGLDPVAKRRMWELISEVSKNRSTIITTHSMEEAEALCTKAGIMARGQLLCLGSVQHLKTKYLDGYTIDIFCYSDSTEAEIDAVIQELVDNSLPGSKLAERHGRFLRLDIPSLATLGLSQLFRQLETMKGSEEWKVENYSISQCSLEQVFIKLVNQASQGAEEIAAANRHADGDPEENEGQGNQS